MNRYYLATVISCILLFSLQASEGQDKKIKKEKEKTLIEIVVDEQKKEAGKEGLRRLFATKGVAVTAILPEGDSFNVSADDLFDLLTGNDDGRFSKNLDLDKKSDNK